MRQITMEIEACGQSAQMVVNLLGDCVATDSARRRPLTVICPGGGYGFTSEREAHPIATQLNAMGIHTAILYYSTAPAAQFPTALAQLATAVATARANAADWDVAPDAISIMGFSAGGHLAGSLSVLWNQPVLRDALPRLTADQVRPNRAILCYPVISPYEYRHEGSFKNLLGSRYSDPEWLKQVALDQHVSADTPPTFLWHTAEDTLVPPQNSMLYASALLQHQVPCELHLYPKGCHGISLATPDTTPAEQPDMVIPSCQNWIHMAGRFLLMDLA
ncbi:alpha/beta hydrolase [Ruminococcaceae bacterium OttesenSCG-928-L11]|nr:alpha/beta hydrolase [Ruminococcaceae bacterium OttesenSCG-928-L11]